MVNSTTRKTRHLVSSMTFVLFLMANWLTAEVVTKSLTFKEPPIFIVDPATNSANKLILLQNSSSNDINILLHVGEFKSKIRGDVLNANVTFSTIEGIKSGPIYNHSKEPLKPGEILFVNMEVTNLWEAGESEATLFNNNEEVGTLTALKYRLPFNIMLDASRHENSKLVMERNKPTRIYLKNEDPMTYPVKWVLSINGTSINGPEVVLPPNGEEWIEIKPKKSLFTSRFGGLFKPDTKEGMLTLTFQPPESEAAQYLLNKNIPINVSLYYWPKKFKWQFVSTLIILIVLALGGVCSMILSYGVPNRLQSLDLKEKLVVLARKTRDLSHLIDSSLRVLVRVERYRLEKMLESQNFFSPQLASTFSQCLQGITMLNKKIDLLERIDTIYGHLVHVYSSNPLPTLIPKIEEALSKASDLLKHEELQESDIQTIQSLIAEASLLLDNYGKDDKKFAQDLEGRIKHLKGKFSPDKDIAKTQIYKEIQNKLPVLFKMLENEDNLDQTKISCDEYCRLDIFTSKLTIIRDYIHLHEYWPNGNTPAYFEDCKKRLLEYLHLESWNAIRNAQLLVQQMKEGIYSDDIKEDIKNIYKVASIYMEPQTAYAKQPVQLTVRFNDEKLNSSAASEEFMFVWKFGHQGLSERGREVTHFFPDEQGYTVEVEFEDEEGKPIKNDDGQTITLKKEISVSSPKKERIGQRTKIEYLNLVIALFIVLIGLLAGAKEQILKLDIIAGLIAVFLLGFGADTIKSILTPRQRKDQ